MAEIESRAHSFMIKFRFKVSDLRNSLNVVNSAADQIRGSAKLERIMQIILYLRRALNQEGFSSIQFGLHSILKLTETRARDNKMTLMHYLCKMLADKQPDTIDFWEDLPDVEPASKIQLRFLAEEMQAVSKGLEKMEQVVSLAENDGSLSEHFLEAWEEFLSFAEDEVRALDSLYSVVTRDVEAVSRYFGEDPSRCTFEKVASNLLYFVRMFRQAHDENASMVS